MGTPFKMKGSPFQRNYGIGSPLHEDKPVKVKTKKPTQEELIAQADAQFGDGVEKSGGNKTVQGTFIQDERGSSIAGSSIEHKQLRDKDRADENQWKKKMTSADRERLRELNELTEKAYKNQGLGNKSNQPSQSKGWQK